MPVIVRVVVPALDSVTCWTALVVPTSCAPKVNAAVLRLIAVLVPFRGTLTVPLAGSSAVLWMVSAATREPAAPGLNVTLMVQFVLVAGATGAGSPVPQLFDCRKSVAFAPP